MAIPKRVSDRIKDSLRRYQKVLEAQRDRDVSEADTVTVVKDILADVFGFDKYAEITGEHAIRGTFCDLAIAIDGKLRFLIEVKAIGLDLKDAHVKQAVDYAANQGCDWVVLTNGIHWVLYHIQFSKPIDKQEIASINLLQANPRSDGDLERLYLLTKEGVTKSALNEYRDRQEAMSRYVLAALLLECDSITQAIRREVRRLSGQMVEPEELRKALRDSVIKREALEGEQASAATRRVTRIADKPSKRRPSRHEDSYTEPDPAESVVNIE
jgi:Uncharacterized conserved protein